MLYVGITRYSNRHKSSYCEFFSILSVLDKLLVKKFHSSLSIISNDNFIAEPSNHGIKFTARYVNCHAPVMPFATNTE
ncbi:MAG: hypothetical protein QOK88_03485, partial [Nitrososphaeraceae archaeon]|nr:hypothetical protein [Nitrososphaeraceae archaeon]